MEVLSRSKICESMNSLHIPCISFIEIYLLRAYYKSCSVPDRDHATINFSALQDNLQSRKPVVSINVLDRSYEWMFYSLMYQGRCVL